MNTIYAFLHQNEMPTNTENTNEACILHPEADDEKDTYILSENKLDLARILGYFSILHFIFVIQNMFGLTGRSRVRRVEL